MSARGTRALPGIAAFFKTAAKFSQFSRVADFCDKPRLGSGGRWHLLQDGLPARCWPEGDRVTSLRDGDVVLPSVLAEEQSLFALEQVGEIQSAYRYIDFKFHTLVSFLFLVFFFDRDFPESLHDCEVN